MHACACAYACACVCILRVSFLLEGWEQQEFFAILLFTTFKLLSLSKPYYDT